jgi:hypothetical protein
MRVIECGNGPHLTLKVFLLMMTLPALLLSTLPTNLKVVAKC